MSRKKKNGNKTSTEKIVLVTVLIQLIKALIERINKLIEQGQGERSPSPKG